MHPALWTLFSASVGATPPEPDFDAFAVVDGADTVTVSWVNEPTGTADVRVVRGTTSTVFPTTVGTVSAGTGSLQDTGISAGTYYYRAIALDSGGNILATSDTGPVTVTGSLSVPVAPTNLQVSLVDDGDTARLTWTDNASSETSYEVERRDDDAGGDFETLADGLAADLETYDDTTGVGGTTYSYRVAARNSNGLSEYSNVVSQLIGIPEAPTDLSVTSEDESTVELSWTDGGGPGVSFEILQDGEVVKTVAIATTTTQVTDLTEGVLSTWAVRAVNANGESGLSNEVEQAPKLAQPTDFSVQQIGGTGSSGFLRFTWTDNSAREGNYVLQKDGSDFRTLPAGATQTDVENGSDQAAGTYRVYATASGLPSSDFSGTVSGPAWPS